MEEEERRRRKKKKKRSNRSKGNKEEEEEGRGRKTKRGATQILIKESIRIISSFHKWSIMGNKLNGWSELSYEKIAAMSLLTLDEALGYFSPLPSKNLV